MDAMPFTVVQRGRQISAILPFHNAPNNLSRWRLWNEWNSWDNVIHTCDSSRWANGKSGYRGKISAASSPINVGIAGRKTIDFASPLKCRMVQILWLPKNGAREDIITLYRWVTAGILIVCGLPVIRQLIAREWRSNAVRARAKNLPALQI
jgi:hypothetical protein